MPNASKRTQSMPSSPIRKLAGYAVEAEKRGVHVHYLSIGQPDIAAPESFWNEVGGHSGPLSYTASQGIAPLRDAVAEDYRKRGIRLAATDLLVTVGASEATYFTFMTCFDEGDEVIVVEPFYANYLGFAHEAGVKLVPISTRIEDDFALPRASDIAAKITPRTKGILVCNPSNPTGTIYTVDQLMELAKITKQHNLFFVLDEVYRDFYFGTAKLMSGLEIEGLDENVVVLDSASKRFSLCGARVGFFISRNRDLIAGALKYGQARLSCPTLDQEGVVSAYRRTPQSYFNAVRTEYMARRDLIVELLSKIPGVVCPKIDGAFYALVRLPVDDADKFCEWMLTSFELNGETVQMAPASGFYATPGLGKDEVRIAYVLEKDKLTAAIRCIGAALAKYPGAVRTSVASI